MKFLLITVLLGVVLAACDAYTVDEVKDKITGIPDKSQIDYQMDGHKAWEIKYIPEDGVVSEGTLSLDKVILKNLSDIHVNGNIIETGVNEFEIPLQANYKYELEYDMNITGLMQNNGTIVGEINEFSPVAVVKINDDGTFQYVEIKSLTLGSVPLKFLHSKLSVAHDTIFNYLQNTFRSIVLHEVKEFYAPLVSKLILSFMKF